MVSAQFIGGGASSLPHSLDPANPGWCGMIGASEEMLTHATQRTVVAEITGQNDLFTLFSFSDRFCTLSMPVFYSVRLYPKDTFHGMKMGYTK